jgi:hypothetical protein
MPPRKLSCYFQVKSLKQTFKKRNPEADIQEIDWGSVCAKGSSYADTFSGIQREYPQFRWTGGALERVDDYSRMALEELNRQAEGLGAKCFFNRDLKRVRI